MRNIITSLAVFGLGVLMSSPAAAAVTLQSSFVGSPVFVTSSTVTVRVSITNNTSGQIPSLAAIRIGYDRSLFRYVSASGGSADGEIGDIDPFAVGAEEVVSGNLVTRDIPTAGNFINTSLNPRVMDVDFEVLTTSGAPTDITLAFDPGVSAGQNSLLDTAAQPIGSRSIDASATSNFLVPVTMSEFEVE